MADDNTFSYSYQTGDPTPASQPAAAPAINSDDSLYAFMDCEAVSLQNGGVLLIHKHSDKQMIVASEVAIALQSCRKFRTLQQHVDVITTTIPQLAGQQGDVAQVLEMVNAAGLLTTALALCERIGSSAEAPTSSTLPPTRVFIITCDRPQAIARLLQSMLFAGKLSRHEQLLLIDDSRDPENARLNREVVEKFNLSSPRDMHYVGSEAQEQLLDTLVADLPEQARAIRFLIDRERWSGHRSYGLARTLCLLFSVDCRAIIMDDDVICAAVTSPHEKAGLAFTDTPREVEFYTSEADILAHTAKADFDPLTGHGECLGLTLSQAINKLGVHALEEQDLRDANAAYLSQWHADSPVLITQTGTIGDPGTVGTEWVYTVDPVSARRLLATQEGLTGALTNRHYWMGHPRATFTKLAVISQVTGLDNSHLLPPYFPVFRGEDYLFGAMVEYLHPQAAVLEYNWCVPHFPLEERSGAVNNKPVTGRGGINLSKYITDHTVYEPGLSTQTRLSGLAQLLQELAESSDEGLLTLYRTEVAESQAAQTKRYAAKLEDGTPRPDPWQTHLQQCLGNIVEAMNSPARPTDIATIPDNYTERAILDEFRTYSGEFALALEGWPSIREAAKRIALEMLKSGKLTH